LESWQSGNDISRISSVASFFLSGLITNIDKRVMHTSRRALMIFPRSGPVCEGQSSDRYCQNRLQKYKEIIQTDRWKLCHRKGASPLCWPGQHQHQDLA